MTLKDIVRNGGVCNYCANDGNHLCFKCCHNRNNRESVDNLLMPDNYKLPKDFQEVEDARQFHEDYQYLLSKTGNLLPIEKVTEFANDFRRADILFRKNQP